MIATFVHDIVDERTFSVIGIGLQTTNGGAATNNLVCSNMIYNGSPMAQAVTCA
ncbi:MAG: hypothetical protein R2818_05920 [Flavobacteriales bacterium]